jgi:hypothetical protein
MTLYGRYFEVLPLRNKENIVSLGEGMTPLWKSEKLGTKIGIPNLWVKDEGWAPPFYFFSRSSLILFSFFSRFFLMLFIYLFIYFDQVLFQPERSKLEGQVLVCRARKSWA